MHRAVSQIRFQESGSAWDNTAQKGDDIASNYIFHIEAGQ